ncbi:MAG: hypothetical protein ACJASQ_002732 [Crocinitomicaceae bacterium]|jgi:hypothetical protein
MTSNSTINLFVNFSFLSESENDLTIQSQKGNDYRIFIQEINLNKERSIKIQKEDLGEPNANLWVCLVLIMEGMEPTPYLIPSLQLTKPDNFVFIYNKLNEPFEHLSNYEIKVFKNGMERLNEFTFESRIGELT